MDPTLGYFLIDLCFVDLKVKIFKFLGAEKTKKSLNRIPQEIN